MFRWSRGCVDLGVLSLNTNSASPAEELEGLVLPGGWTVGPRITPSGGTGGAFSSHYRVSSAEGKEAFLKALDVKALFANSTKNFIDTMKEHSVMYAFERDMLEKCRDMKRVVTSLATGEATVPNSQYGPVPYFIFDLATGDVRSHLNGVAAHDEISWKLRSLHHIAVALGQLHRGFIAHQDVKPSNILVFGKADSRIGDLGRVSERGVNCPFDDRPSAGDATYAPPEIYYGYQPSEWHVRRFGVDVYLLGSMAVYFFTQLTMNSLLYQNMSPQLLPSVWRGGYEPALPYLQDAFVKALDQFRIQIPSQELASSLRSVVSEMCNPDVHLRGSLPARRRGNSPLSMEIYISKFNMLAKRAEMKMFR